MRSQHPQPEFVPRWVRQLIRYRLVCPNTRMGVLLRFAKFVCLPTHLVPVHQWNFRSEHSSSRFWMEHWLSVCTLFSSCAICTYASRAYCYADVLTLFASTDTIVNPIWGLPNDLGHPGQQIKHTRTHLQKRTLFMFAIVDALHPKFEMTYCQTQMLSVVQQILAELKIATWNQSHYLVYRVHHWQEIIHREFMSHLQQHQQSSKRNVNLSVAPKYTKTSQMICTDGDQVQLSPVQALAEKFDHCIHYSRGETMKINSS